MRLVFTTLSLLFFLNSCATVQTKIDEKTKEEQNKLSVYIGKNIEDFDFNKSIPTALIVGAEYNGVSKSIIEKSDFILKIPMSGDVSSLNVSVATGITLYKLKFQ